MFIDTHVHLNDVRYTDTVDKIRENYLAEGVEKVINIGFDIPSSFLAASQADKYAEVYFAAGVHPSDSKQINSKNIERLRELSRNKKCVAIGEIGFDYHYDDTDKIIQKTAFEMQLQLAFDEKLPIIIHSRDACADTLAFLKERKELLKYGGVMHCFSGSVETANEYLKLGLYISFSGTVTFKNSRNLSETAIIVPKDKFLAETDCPYLSPEPLRGTINQPSNVVLVTKKLATLRNEKVEDTAQYIMQNACALFKKIRN